MPVKVEKMNAYLTQILTRSIKIKSGKKMIHPGQYRRYSRPSGRGCDDVGEKNVHNGVISKRLI